MADVMAVVYATHDKPMMLVDHGSGRTRWVCRDCDREETDAVEAKAAYKRAMAWALSVAGTPYGSATPTLNKETR